MSASHGQERSDSVSGADVSAAVSLGRSDNGASTQVNSRFPQSRRTDAPGFSTPVASSPRVGPRALDRIAHQLSDRDFDVLRRLAQHGYLTTLHVQQFVFTEHATGATAHAVTRRTLGRLERGGLVRSIRQRVGGVRAGSAAKVWQLAPAGTRLLADQGARQRTKQPSLRFLAHTLAIADTHLVLRNRRQHGNVESVAVEVEPMSWRRYQGSGGERRTLQPDLYAEIMTSRYVDRMFIEVDRGTESMRTLLNQCDQYEAYRRTGVEKTRHGSTPIVLWILPDGERAVRLAKAIQGRSGLIPAMFRFATPDTLDAMLEEQGI